MFSRPGGIVLPRCGANMLRPYEAKFGILSVLCVLCGLRFLDNAGKGQTLYHKGRKENPQRAQRGRNLKLFQRFKL